ncbi:unnamed protein product [Rotaria sp. Silwood2]|nr:unnamed protein product [Rotaria sp. Silwood2]CAF4339486.1 unnamed protein product [Rotaria sp. Silwood2]
MIEKDRREYWSSIIQILIDLSNLIEQLIVYFIVKQESNNNKYEERLFFFVLLIIGLLSNLPSASPYLYIQTIGSISIEFGELLSYLFLLKKSISVFLASFISFSIEVILHSINIIVEYNSIEKTNHIFIFGKTTSSRIKYVLIRSISYSIFNATSILFLFLDDNSRFHYKFYEILILLTFYFPSIALGPALESITKYKYEYEQGQIPRITIFLVWSLICATLYFIMYCIPLSITGVFFSIQQLKEITPPYGYDFVVYVSSLTFFSIAIIIFPPFMIWWWRFTYQRFKNMRIDAKKRLKQINEQDSAHYSL